jgi:hypothetical protein
LSKPTTKSETKSGKRTYRELQYSKMAEGYRILKSPVAGSYNAAAEHYKENDPPLDHHDLRGISARREAGS